MWCNNTLDTDQPPTKKEYDELNEILSDFEENLDSSNIRYWRLRNKGKQ